MGPPSGATQTLVKAADDMWWLSPADKGREARPIAVVCEGALGRVTGKVRFTSLYPTCTSRRRSRAHHALRVVFGDRVVFNGSCPTSNEDVRRLERTRFFVHRVRPVCSRLGMKGPRRSTVSSSRGPRSPSRRLPSSFSRRPAGVAAQVDRAGPVSALTPHGLPACQPRMARRRLHP